MIWASHICSLFTYYFVFSTYFNYDIPYWIPATLSVPQAADLTQEVCGPAGYMHISYEITVTYTLNWVALFVPFHQGCTNCESHVCCIYCQWAQVWMDLFLLNPAEITHIHTSTLTGTQVYVVVHYIWFNWITFIYLLIFLQSLGNSQKEYEKAVVNYSVKNQLRYKGNLGKFLLSWCDITKYRNLE